MQTYYRLNEILVLTLLALPVLAGYQFFQPIPGTDREIA